MLETLGGRLPPEIWGLILHPDSGLDPQHLKAASLVSRLFHKLAQPHLFYNFSGSPHLELLHWVADPDGRGKRMDWTRFQKELAYVMRTAKRLQLIGSNPSLARATKSLVIDAFAEPGLEYFWHVVKIDAFGNTQSRPATGAILAATSRLRQTLFDFIPSYVNLRTLNLRGVHIEAAHLDVISSHRALQNIALNRCSYEPITHTSHTTYLSASSLDLYLNIHQFVKPACGLISPTHLTKLCFNTRIDAPRHTTNLGVFLNLYSRVQFPKLEELKLIVDREVFANPAPARPVTVYSMVQDLLAKLPALRRLVVAMDVYSLGKEQTFDLEMSKSSREHVLCSTKTLNCLESIHLPLSWVRALVPGRPVHTIELQLIALFGSRTPTGPITPVPFGSGTLIDILTPLTFSTVPIRKLHFPAHPIAPLKETCHAVVELFPDLSDLQISFRIQAMPQLLRRSAPIRRSNPGIEEVGEDELKSVEARVFRSVEDDLACGEPRSSSEVDNRPQSPASPTSCAWDARVGRAKAKVRESTTASPNDHVYEVSTRAHGVWRQGYSF